MTCIVGLIGKDKKVYIGGDSATTAGTHRSIMSGAKTFVLKKKTKNKIIKIGIGYSGSIRIGQLLQYQLNIPVPGKTGPHEYVVTKLVPAIVETVQTTCKNTDEGLSMQDGSMLMIGYSGHLFTIWWDLNVEEKTENFSSIGSGSPYALGCLFNEVIVNGQTLALTAEEIVYNALECACNYDSSCCGPFNIISV